MPLFDWNSPASSSILSSKFWIYWAVTIPTTILVLVVWRFWYVFDEWRWNNMQNETVYKDFRAWLRSDKKGDLDWKVEKRSIQRHE